MSTHCGASTRTRLAVVGCLVAAAALLTGCAEVVEEAHEGYQPAAVEEVADGDIPQVTFTQVGADHVDLETATARTVGKHTVVPYAALIYDGQGVPWVYTVPAPLTFVRVTVEVDRVEDDDVWLSAGLDSGTEVVTTGATEVYGAELDIAGGH